MNVYETAGKSVVLQEIQHPIDERMFSVTWF